MMLDENCPCCHTTPEAVWIKGVSVHIGGVNILEGIEAHVPRNGCTAIVGPNGSGKTTLVKALIGEVEYTGSIYFDGKNGYYTEKRPKFGYVPQKLQFDREMPLTVMEFLACNMQRRPIFFGISGKFRSAAREYLREVECSHLENRQLGALSGGELQRVLLAQALMREPEIMILDEPAAGVDFKGEALCCELMENFQKKFGFTQIMVSHDLSTIAAHARHVICMNHKVYAEGDPCKVLNTRTLSDTFGLHMGSFKFDINSKEGTKCSCH